MDNTICVDCQSVILLNGQEANVDLEYNPDTDQFIVTADAGNWIDNYTDFMKENYPDEEIDTDMFDEAREDYERISGYYNTLREVNEVLEQWCDDYYEFHWEYEDGIPVE